MTHLFNLWNLFETGHRVCEFDVTAANLPRIRHGSQEFVDACLKGFSVQATAQTWSIHPFRSYYLSDYIDPDEEWVDRWYPGWSLRVTLSSDDFEDATCAYDLPICLDARDSSWTGDYFDPRHDTTALLVSIHEGSPDDVRQIGDKLAEAARTDDSPAPPPRPIVRTIGDGLQQLRICVGGVCFPEWERTGGEILRRCQQYGGTINYRHLH